MTQTTAQLLIWIAAVATLVIAVVAMAYRRLFREYPVFSCFIVYELMECCATQWGITHFDSNHYFFLYWPLDLIEALFCLFLIQELFRVVLKPYRSFRSVALTLYWSGAMVFVPIAVWMQITTPPATDAKITNMLISAQRSLSFVQLSLVLLLFVFCHLFALHWRPYSLGMALGLGFWACTQLLAAAYRVHAGYNWGDAYSWAAPLSFDVGVVIWAFYLVRDEAVMPVPEALLSPQLARWDVALDEMLAR